MDSQVTERFDRAIVNGNGGINTDILYAVIGEIPEENAKRYIGQMSRDELEDQLYRFMVRSSQLETNNYKNKRMIFDSNTEQLSLFEDDEQFIFEYLNSEDPVGLVDPVNVKAHQRRRPGHKTIEDIKESIKDEVTLDFYPEDIDYKNGEYEEIGTDTKVQFVYIPAHMQKQILVIHKYVKKNETDPDKSPIYSGRYAKLIEGSVITPSLMSSILFNRYLLGLPMGKVSKLFSEIGFVPSDQTLRNWCSMTIRNYFSLMHNYILEDARMLDVAHMDEVHLPCMESQKLGLGKNTNIFSLISGKYEEKQLVYFAHTIHKKADFLVPILGEKFNGHAMSDDWVAYEKYLAKTKGRCLLHSRRRFVDIYKQKEKKIQEYLSLESEEERKAWSENPLNRMTYLVLRILYCFHMIYEVEADLTDLEEIRKVREEKSSLYFYQIELDCNEILKNTKKGTKLFNSARYFIKNEMELAFFIFDPKLPKDNNRLERENRRISLYRNTSFKVNSFKGAEELAIIQTIIASAEINGLYVQAYLNYFLEQCQGQAITDELLERLAPYSRQLPKELFNPNSVYYDPFRVEGEEEE